MVRTNPVRLRPVSPSRTLGAAWLVVLAALVTACGEGGHSTAADTAPTTTVVAESFPRCIPGTEDAEEKRVHDLLQERLDLRRGECVFRVSLGSADGKTDRTLAEVSLALWTARSVEDLRPAATEIARAMKSARVTPPIDDLVVTNMGAYRRGDQNLGFLEFLRDRAFEAHSWDGSTGRDAEFAQWEVDTKAD